jgi:hypothetical protein
MAKKKSSLEELAAVLAAMELAGPPKPPEKFSDRWVLPQQYNPNDQPVIAGPH